jgi:hypothetical protein
MKSARRGQSTTEYFLVISFLCVALVASAWLFVPTYRDGMRKLGTDVSRVLLSGTEDGSGGVR